MKIILKGPSLVRDDTEAVYDEVDSCKIELGRIGGDQYDLTITQDGSWVNIDLAYPDGEQLRLESLLVAQDA